MCKPDTPGHILFILGLGLAQPASGAARPPPIHAVDTQPDRALLGRGEPVREPPCEAYARVHGAAQHFGRRQCEPHRRRPVLAQARD